MRPLYLKIEGLKSVAEPQTIDFERVSRNGIFGVFGKTGSGKSTILDAIVLAVYGEVTEKIENSEFVNKGMNHTFVDFVFSVSKDNVTTKYRVERLYKFGKDRKNLTASAKLWKFDEQGNEYIETEGASSVTSMMKDEIIGLDKNDFLKCIALPQGEFSAFVKMTKGDRLKVIGKLFDLEKYGTELCSRVRAENSRLEYEIGQLKSKLEEIDEYSPEKFKILKADFENVSLEFNEIKAEKIKSDKQKEDAVLVKKQLEERIERLKEKSDKSAYKPVIDGYKEEIERFEELEKISDAITGYTKTGEIICLNNEKLSTLYLDKKALEERKEILLKEKGEIPEKQEKISLFKVQMENILSSGEKQKKLEDLNSQLSAKRREYSSLIDEKNRLLKEAEAKNEEKEKYENLSRGVNCEELLSKLSEKLSGAIINEFAKERLAFIDGLKKLIDGNLKNECESAVNGLIAREIEKLRGLISAENESSVDELLERVSLSIKKSNEYKSNIEKCIGEINALNIKRNSLEEKMEKSLEDGKQIRENYDEIKVELERILLGKTYDEALSEVKKSIFNLTSEINTTEKNYENLTEKLYNLGIEISALESTVKKDGERLNLEREKIETVLNEKNLTMTEAKAILSDENSVIKHKKIVETYTTEMDFIERRLGELNGLLEKNTLSMDEIVEICNKNQEINEKFNETNKKYGEINSIYKIGSTKTEKWCIINKNIMELCSKQLVVGRLLSLLDKNRFMEFVAEEYLTEVAQDAQVRLLELTGGVYGLRYENGNFYVTDNLRGGVTRPISGLSGGETFLVSLSLALALSSQISLKALRPIDFFFLDEGFGTLDDDLIEAVTDSLEKLQRANFTVGLITHVTELKNRIQSKILVTAATATRGTVIEDNY